MVKLLDSRGTHLTSTEKMMKKISVLTVLGLAAGLAGPVVWAHDDGASQDNGSCRAEAEKACPDMKPGDGKFGPCMKEHKDQFSKDCQDKIGGKAKDGME